jgi:hypothetical protein
MHTETYVTALREDLARVAALGDESTARAADLLAIALESSIGRRLQEALAEAARDLSSQLDHGRVEVRVAGSDPELIYVDEPAAETETTPEPDDESLAARITLRLSERLKARLEGAAVTAGMSLNAWLVQTLNRSLESPPTTTSHGPGRHRLTGRGRA